MKHTEKEILEIVKKVLKDLEGEYYKEANIENVFFDKDDKLIRGENIGKPHYTWTIAIKSLFDNTDFLTISDETGEPLYYQNFNMIIAEIKKNEDGKYVTIK